MNDKKRIKNLEDEVKALRSEVEMLKSPPCIHLHSHGCCHDWHHHYPYWGVYTSTTAPAVRYTTSLTSNTAGYAGPAAIN